MKYRDFIKTFQPIKNHLVEDAPLDGYMFETLGKEVEIVKSHPPTKVWTVIEDDGQLYIIPYYHVANRVGYIITERFCEDIEVDLNL